MPGLELKSPRSTGNTALSGAMVWLALLVVAFFNTAKADDEYLGLIASGRFDQVVARYQPLEEQGRTNTSELHALCLSYAKLKNYDKIFSCVSKLSGKGGGAQRSSRLFGTSDVTPIAQLFA